VTIESASHPEDLNAWDGEGAEAFYFEIFGETSPVVDTAIAEVVPAGATPGSAAQSAQPAPVYEYWWTIGHPGHRPDDGGPLRRIKGPGNLWERLPRPAARVYLFFPLGGGWRVKELAATVNYMSPVAHQDSFIEKAAKDWQAIQPLVTDASTLASAAGAVAGAASAGSARALSALAQLKLSSVPPMSGFEWAAGKVAFSSEHGAAQGVMWTLPPEIFRELGGRITGALALSVVPDRAQRGGNVLATPPDPQPQDLLAHAVVYSPDGHDDDRWAPATDKFVHLRIAPLLPASGTPSSVG